MSSSTVVRAACFAVGAIVGGGVAIVVGSKKRESVPPVLVSPGSSAAPPAVTPAGKASLPFIDTTTHGDVRVSTSLAALAPVLKYGNPGTLSTSTRCSNRDS